jgi:hypothetical protein
MLNWKREGGGRLVWRIKQNIQILATMLTIPGRFMLLISLIPSVQFLFMSGLFYVKEEEAKEKVELDE